MFGRVGRAHREHERTATAAHVEFAELLDAVVEPGSDADGSPTPAVDLAPPMTSRFADSGLDDDRLPQRPAKRRRRS